MARWPCEMLLLISALGAQTVPPGELYREAVTLYQAGDIAGAIGKYEALLKLNPAIVEARTNLGVAQARLGRYSEAIDNYRLALEQDRGNPVIRLNLGLAYYKQSEYEKAAEELRGLYRGPGNRQALYLLADCYLRLGRDKDVIALLEPVDRRDSRDRAVSYLLGTALIRDGQIQEGQRIIDRILREGESAEANLLLGSAQLAAKDRKAGATIRRAIELDSALPGAYSLYGRAQMESGDDDGAKESFRRALEADPNDFDANLNLGALLRGEGELEPAAGLLAQAVRLRPGSLAARFQMGAVNAARGRLEDARKDLEKVAEASPDFQEVHVQLAALYYRMNLKEEGMREREIVLKLNEKARRR